jgi:hypothetical protein
MYIVVKKKIGARHRWLIPIFPASWEAENERITVLKASLGK